MKLVSLGIVLSTVSGALFWDYDGPLPTGVTKETCMVEGAAVLDAGTVYLSREVPCLKQTDGGLIYPRWPLRADRLPWFIIFNKSLVTEFPSGCDGGFCDNDEDGAGTPQTRPKLLQCACRPTGNICRYTLPDGGTPLVPLGETAGPGYDKTNWFGVGCVRKACVELSGYDSMPAECK